MPAVILYGRRWHTATDTIPFPAFFAAAIHASWVVVFGWLISVYNIWTTPCQGQGVHYKVVTAAFMGLYGSCFLVEAALTGLGMRGAPMETHKRRWMIPMLYLLSWLWLFQFMITIYGTCMLPYASPVCYPGLSQQGHVRNVVRTMIYTTWALCIGTLFVLLATYNSYGTTKKSKARNWEGRMKCLSFLMGCSEAMAGGGNERAYNAEQQESRREAPLPGIAHMIASLFENIDLSPSDITAAIVLAAAAQQQTRKMRIKQALAPRLKISGRDSVMSEETATETESEISEDDTNLSDVEEGDEKDDADAYQAALNGPARSSPAAAAAPALEPVAQPKDKTEACKVRIRQAGGESGELRKDGEQSVAMPADYPQDWADTAAKAYGSAGIEMGSTAAGREADSVAGSRDHPHAEDDALSTAAQAPEEDGRGAAQTAPERAAAAAEALNFDRGGQHADADGDSVRRDSNSSNGSRTVPLSEVDPSDLEQAGGGEKFNLQRERFGLPQEHAHGRMTGEQAQRMVQLPSLETASIAAETDAGRDAVPAGADPQMVGKLQASMTEEGGGLPLPSELSLANGKSGTASSTVLGGLASVFSLGKSEGVPEMEQHPSMDLDAPLEEHIVAAGPTEVLTPSALTHEVTGSAGVLVEHAEVASEYLGDRSGVPWQTLKESVVYARYSCGVYGVTPMSESEKPTGCYGCRTMPVTANTIRENTIALSGIKDEDLLFFSHSNVALAHLPYMVALERERKAVVLAIRGTSSLADVITDAVVRPAPVDDWLPQQYKSQMTERQQKRMFAHQGIVAAASAILEDLEKNGMLSRLMRHESERKADENHSQQTIGRAQSQTHAQRAGTIMQELLDKQDWKLVVTGHSLGAGAAALLTLQLKDRYPDLKCWAYSPPGGLVSRSLLKIMEQWTVSVVCGKDAVPRASVNNLSRLMDQMVVSLARCKYHKLRVVAGAWWKKENRPPPEHLFCSYNKIPKDARDMLARYFKSREMKGKAMDMFPPGRIVFVRPIKQVDKAGHAIKSKKQWDAVWVQPTEIIAEGILVSPKMLSDHLIESTVITALEYASDNHPGNPRSKSERKKSVADAERRGKLAELVIHSPNDPEAPGGVEQSARSRISHTFNRALDAIVPGDFSRTNSVH